MSLCYYCSHGEPAAFVAIRDELEARGFEPRWGPGHVVFEDHNLWDEIIDHCIDGCKNLYPWQSHHSLEELAATVDALRLIKQIPIAEREPPEMAVVEKLPHGFKGKCPCKPDCAVIF